MTTSTGSPLPAAFTGAAAAPRPYQRYPLGLPAGSVRALLTFMVLGCFWTLLIASEQREVYVPSYLYYLMFLIVGAYFAHRSHGLAAHGEAPPLYLPGGTFRVLIVLGFLGVVGWVYYHNPDFLHRLKLADEPYLPLLLLAAFFLGVLIARVSARVLAGPAGLPSWFQDLQAWVSLIAVLGMGAEILIHLVINPNLAEDKQLKLPNWEGFFAAVVAFYFGVRS
jgi:hypothetical protein